MHGDFLIKEISFLHIGVFNVNDVTWSDVIYFTFLALFVCCIYYLIRFFEYPQYICIDFVGNFKFKQHCEYHSDFNELFFLPIKLSKQRVIRLDLY